MPWKQYLNIQQREMRSFNYCFRLRFPLSTIICACAMVVFSAAPVRAADDACANLARVKIDIFLSELRSVSLQRTRYSYHSDSEEYRIDHLNNRRHGSDSAFAYSYNKDRIQARPGNAVVNILLPAKENTPWSRLKLKLSERWLLDADLYYADSRNEENNHGFKPTPRLSYEFGTIKLVTRYIPHIQDYNASALMAFYLSVTLY